jgi:replication factor A1
MNAKEIIDQILSTRPDISREEILRKIAEKKTAAGGFLSEETAARLVASELGVEIVQESFYTKEIPIGDLVSGLNNVTVTGRVLVVFPTQTYSRKDETEGRFSQLLIADKTGTLRIMLWNDKAELARNGQLKQGQILHILHGYVREARNGDSELHVGHRGEIQINPSDIKESNYPEPANFFAKIGKISAKQKKANVIGTVQSISQTTVFQRRDGTEGKVVRVTLEDATGQMTVVFWNAKVDAVSDVHIGDRLEVIDARVKERIDGRLELHVENRAHVVKLPLLAEEIVKIKSLDKEGGPISIEGIVKTKPVKREVTTSRGEKISVTSFELTDVSGSIWVSAWRKHADIAAQLVVGTKVKIKDVYVRKGFVDNLEIATKTSSKIEPLSQ